MHETGASGWHAASASGTSTRPSNPPTGLRTAALKVRLRCCCWLRVGLSILQTMTDMWAIGIDFYPVCGQGKLLQIFFDRIEGLGPQNDSWLTRHKTKASLWTHFDRYRPGIKREAVSILKHHHHRWHIAWECAHRVRHILGTVVRCDQFMRCRETPCSCLINV